MPINKKNKKKIPTLHSSPEADVARWVVNFEHEDGSQPPYGKWHPQVELPLDSLDFDRMLNGFFAAFGVARPLIRGEFREKAKELMKNRKTLRKSALRWMLEGKLPGVKQPVQRYRFMKRLHEVLLLADLAETFLFDYQRKIYGRKHPESSERTPDVGSDGVRSGVSLQASTSSITGIQELHGEKGRSPSDNAGKE